jgi:hypothetical protein
MGAGALAAEAEGPLVVPCVTRWAAKCCANFAAKKILQIFIVVVVVTVHRDAVALEFAAHVETGPRKQDCPSVPASGALTTLRRSEDAGVSGERGGQKSKPLMQVPSRGRNLGLLLFLLSLGVVTMKMRRSHESLSELRT